MATMPNITGLNWQDGISQLIQAGITPNDGQVPNSTTPNIGYYDLWPVNTTWVKSTTVKPGFIISQSPGAGTTNVPLGFAVSITVSNYPMAVADLFSAGALNL